VTSGRLMRLLSSDNLSTTLKFKQKLSSVWSGDRRATNVHHCFAGASWSRRLANGLNIERRKVRELGGRGAECA